MGEETSFPSIAATDFFSVEVITRSGLVRYFVRSIKSECLSQIIPLGEEHLRHAVKEYTEHYHLERNHQGLDNRLIEERHGAVDMDSALARHERLGGILNYYERRAA